MITVVILAFNEEEHLEKTIETIRSASMPQQAIPLDIIIINDGSRDKTADIIMALQGRYPFIRSIHHQENKGPGYGVKEAIRIAQYPKFIVVPGDNDLSRELVTELFANRDKAQLVMAYYKNMHVRGWLRSSLSMLYTWIYRLTFNIPIHYINSPCLYPTDKLRLLTIRSDRFGYSAEMTVKILRQGTNFTQVGGQRQVHSVRSSSISWKNLSEVVEVYLKLILDVKILSRDVFNHKPQEVI